MSRSRHQLHRALPDGNPSVSRLDRGAILRGLAAELADRMAEHADQFATYLENAATRGDRERRLAVSKTEREIARI